MQVFVTEVHTKSYKKNISVGGSTYSNCFLSYPAFPPLLFSNPIKKKKKEENLLSYQKKIFSLYWLSEFMLIEKEKHFGEEH